MFCPYGGVSEDFIPQNFLVHHGVLMTDVDKKKPLVPQGNRG